MQGAGRLVFNEVSSASRKVTKVRSAQVGFEFVVFIVDFPRNGVSLHD